MALTQMLLRPMAADIVNPLPASFQRCLDYDRNGADLFARGLYLDMPGGDAFEGKAADQLATFTASANRVHEPERAESGEVPVGGVERGIVLER
jgi:hypothetical protein